MLHNDQYKGIQAASDDLSSYGGVQAHTILSHEQAFDFSAIQNIRRGNLRSEPYLIFGFRLFCGVIAMFALLAYASTGNIIPLIGGLFSILMFALTFLKGNKAYHAMCEATAKRELILGEEGLKISLAILNSQWMNHMPHDIELAKAGFPYLFIPWQQLEQFMMRQAGNPDYHYYHLILINSRLGTLSLSTMVGNRFDLQDLFQKNGIDKAIIPYLSQYNVSHNLST
jgi:hypothetical protein